MHAIRRTVFRSAVSASRQVASKATSTPSPAQIALRATAAKQTSVYAARYFSQTICFQNEEQQNVGEQEQSSPESAVPESAVPESAVPESAVPESAPTETGFQSRPQRRSTDLFPNGVFVRNLIFDATEAHLKAAFEKYGEVVDVFLMRDARGLSKGHGFVYFKDPEAVTAAIENVDGSFWHGRRINVSPKQYKAKPAVTTSNPAASTPSKTLYVGNIPYETTDAELNRIFRDLDNVVDIRVAVDRTTGWPRGFAHADFADVESAVKACEKLQGIAIGERVLRIDYAAGYQNLRVKKALGSETAKDENTTSEEQGN